MNALPPAAPQQYADPAEMKTAFLAAIPRMRGFALSLCGRSDLADDLVQEALTKAWAKLGELRPDTNMAAWLHTILRNEFFSRIRKTRREVPDPDGEYAARQFSFPAQDSNIQMQEFRRALFTLPPDQREALMLVGASGLSYEEAAEMCGCAVGTVKSRVNRARKRLESLLSMSDQGFEADSAWGGIRPDMATGGAP